MKAKSFKTILPADKVAFGMALSIAFFAAAASFAPNAHAAKLLHRNTPQAVVIDDNIDPVKAQAQVVDIVHNPHKVTAGLKVFSEFLKARNATIMSNASRNIPSRVPTPAGAPVFKFED